ncbi:AzlD domain-containing protein [Candidatus Pelagibacter sp.]|jgi:branched-subunit amino acid transport protein|nr:AzlD domain-containing protein [Candidatus Pelagibacter sp.]
MSISVVLAILVTSLATFSSRFLGVVSSEGIKETSKLFRWFNCLAYSTLAALIARTIIFPVGVLSDTSYLSRASVVLICLFIFFISKKNFVYPTIISAIMMAILSENL